LVISVKKLRAEEDLQKPALFVAQESGCVTAIFCDVQLKGMDSKLVEMINSRTGAYCYACDVSLKEARQIERGKEGFYMNVSMDRLKEAVETLFSLYEVPEADKEYNEFPSNPVDYQQGLN
jgi:hypothetical protein